MVRLSESPTYPGYDLTRFNCSHKGCTLCKDHIQECTSFITSNNTEWKIQTHITCNSLNVVYFLCCLCCNYETKTGKTNVFRKRMNCHISEIRTGNTSDVFDRHVIECKRIHNVTNEPYFKIYAFITLPREELLLSYESHFHTLGYDTMK